MLTVLRSMVLPGVEARWLDVSEHLDVAAPEAGRAVALVVAPVEWDLWVCCALASPGLADEEWQGAVREMEDEDGIAAVARASAAFGMPWVELSERVLRGQLVLLMRDGGPMHEQIRELSPDQLLALREALHPSSPANMSRALRCCREYAGVTQ